MVNYRRVIARQRRRHLAAAEAYRELQKNERNNAAQAGATATTAVDHAKKVKKFEFVAKTQRHSLRSDAQIFRFLELPAEIRQIILEMLLVDHPDFVLSNVIPVTVAIPDSRILLVNRQIYTEGLPILYGMNAFRCDELSALRRFVEHKPIAAQHVKKIEIFLQARDDREGEFDLYQTLMLDPSKLERTPFQDQHHNLEYALQRLPMVEKVRVDAEIWYREGVPLSYFCSPWAESLYSHPVNRWDPVVITHEFANPEYTGLRTTPKSQYLVHEKEVRRSLIATIYAVRFMNNAYRLLRKCRTTIAKRNIIVIDNSNNEN